MCPEVSRHTLVRVRVRVRVRIRVRVRVRVRVRELDSGLAIVVCRGDGVAH